MQNTLDLKSKNEKDVLRAGEILRKGGIVAIPTETVYGLAADATNEQAVENIFFAKGRPQDNPLIVHIAEKAELASLVAEVPPQAMLLAEKFWPGPLTMVMKKSGKIPEIVCAGLDTVGIRIPEHPAARAVIKAAGRPLAAPSANTSGRPSPTTAKHVRDDMEGKIDAILDGGPCDVGVESTVVDVTCDPPRVLRPGAITLAQLREVLGEVEIDKAVYSEVAAGEKVRAPGMKYRHYAPKAQVILFAGSPRATCKDILSHVQDGDGVLCFDEFKNDFFETPANVTSYGSYRDKQEQARGIFAGLRAFDKTDCVRIFAQAPRPFGEGYAVYNRISKAAGFNIVLAESAHVVGITGASGSGKSTIAQFLEKSGWSIISADHVYHQLLSTDNALRARIAEHFPKAATMRGIDRSILASEAFTNPNSLRLLNAITHPAVRTEISRRVKVLEQQKITKIAIDAPLLFESDIDADCEFVIAATAPRDVALARIMSRDEISAEQAKQRLESQPRDAFYRRFADVIIENDGTEAHLEELLMKQVKIFREN